MRDFYILLIYVALVLFGFYAPFVFTLGYVWVDAFRPQEVSSLLESVPVSLIMGVAALGSFLIAERPKVYRPDWIVILTLCMAVWVTLTCTWSVVPAAAWGKWDWAFKTIVFSAFLPFVLTSRVRLEAMLQVFFLALSVNMMPFGIKSLVSGGGYGRALGVLGENSGLAESSTLAAYTVMFIPLLLFIAKHSVIMTTRRWRHAIYWTSAFVCGAASIGTFARTGLIAFFVLGGFMFMQSRRKVIFAILGCCMAVGVLTSVSTDWTERMSTIETFDSENSALGRILVWKWTLGFAIDNPQGGGFNSYLVDRVEFPPAPGSTQPHVVFAKAFHSIYFEVLGEQGWVGLFLFLALILISARKLWRATKITKGVPEAAWLRDLSKAILVSLMVMCAGGAFIGVAFQPLFWYLFALSACCSWQAKVLIAAKPDPQLARPKSRNWGIYEGVTARPGLLVDRRSVS